MQKLNRFQGWVLGVVFILGSACKSADENRAPDLPPATSLTFDLGALEAAPSAAKNNLATAQGDYANFYNAWVRTAYVRLVAEGVVLVPALTVAAVLQDQPEFVNGGWEWSRTVAQDNDVVLRIEGDPTAGWNTTLHVTNPSVTDFLWLAGHYDPDVTSGSWTIHNPELDASADEALEISWIHVSAMERSVTYEIVDTTSDDVGDVLIFAELGDDASISFTDASDAQGNGVIQWSKSTHAGSLTVPNYNDGLQACWDEAYLNDACPD